MSLEPTQRNQNSDPDASSAENTHYRLRYYFGDFELFSEWRTELTHVENLAEQLRNETTFHDVTIERRTEVRR